MSDRIKLSVDSKYPMLPRRGYDSVQLLGVGPNEAVVYGRDHDSAIYRLVHLHDGIAEQHKLQLDPADLIDGPFGKEKPVLITVGGQLVLLLNLRLLFLIDPTLAVTGQLEVEKDIPELQNLPYEITCPYPDRNTGMSDTSVIPLLFVGTWDGPGQDLSAVYAMAMLDVDVEGKHARWVPCGGEHIFQFDSESFPETHLGDSKPVLHHAALRKGKLHVYTLGNSPRYVKWGMPYFGIATYDQERKLLGCPYLEVPSPEDPKKRGRYGQFSSSLQYCIITPVFRTSDPWKRKQRLFNLDTNELIKVGLPRGYSKHDVVDHAHGTYWLMSTDIFNEIHIASCSAQ